MHKKNIRDYFSFGSRHPAALIAKKVPATFLTNKGQRQSQLNLLEGVFPRIMSSRCICSNKLKATKVQESMMVAILSRLQGAPQRINVKVAV